MPASADEVEPGEVGPVWCSAASLTSSIDRSFDAVRWRAGLDSAMMVKAGEARESQQARHAVLHGRLGSGGGDGAREARVGHRLVELVRASDRCPDPGGSATRVLKTRPSLLDPGA